MTTKERTLILTQHGKFYIEIPKERSDTTLTLRINIDMFIQETDKPSSDIDLAHTCLR